MVKIIGGGNPFGTSITYPFLSSSLQGIIFPQRIRFGGDGSDGAYTAPAGITNISGIKQYSSLSVPVGATLNLTDNTYIFCTGDVSIAGSITCSNAASSSSVSNGNSGALGSIATGGEFGTTFYKYFFNRCALAGGIGGSGGGVSTSSAMSSGGGGGGAGYSTGGFGGGSALLVVTMGGDPVAGGNGGMGLYIECSGNITISGTITLSGQNGTNASGNFSGGSGGGGGGSLFAYALGNANLTGTFNSVGGNGGNGGATSGGGGGGGSGGYFHLGYQGTLTANTLTATVTGGTAGTGGSATNGSNGLKDIYQLKGY